MSASSPYLPFPTPKSGHRRPEFLDEFPLGSTFRIPSLFTGFIMENVTPTANREAWNKGKIVGQKTPLKIK
jgi:hypothetical protein